MKLWTVGLITISVLTTACSPKSSDKSFSYEPIHSPLRGHFEGNRFYDCTGQFSLEVPTLFQSDIFEDASDADHVSMVVFKNWLGDLERVEVATIDDKTMSSLAENTCTWGENLEAAFYLCALELICEEFSGTELLCRKRVHEESREGFYLAVIKIPEGSTVYKNETNQAQDSVRGYLCFFDQSQLVVLSCQRSPIFDDILKEAGKEENYSVHIEWLLDLRARYRNESKR